MEARTGSSIPAKPGSQNEILIFSAPDLQQFIPTRASVLCDQFKPACPVYVAGEALMGVSMSHAGGWVNEHLWSLQLPSLLIIMGIYVRSHLNGSITFEKISRKCSRSWKSMGSLKPYELTLVQLSSPLALQKSPWILLYSASCINWWPTADLNKGLGTRSSSPFPDVQRRPQS